MTWLQLCERMANSSAICISNFCVFIFVTLFYVRLCDGSVTLTIPEAGANGIISARLMQDVQFTCEHNAAIIQPSESINWYAPNNPTMGVTDTNTKAKMFITWESITERRRLTLTIRTFQSSDAGDYYCKYIVERGNTKDELAATFVRLTLAQPIEVVSCMVEQWILDQSSKPDGRATIRCQVNGIPAPVVTWYYKNQPLSTSSKYIYRPHGLDIISPSKSDAGVYTLKAIQENSAHIFMRDITVRVFEKPRIVAGPEVIAPVHGAAVHRWDATLRCVAEGDPMPTIHWYRTKSPTMELQDFNPHKFFVNSNPNFGYLQIVRATYPEDDGIYICRASVTSPAIDIVKEDMYTEKQVNVTVVVAPEFTNWDRMIGATDLGGKVLVTCRVYATDPVMQYQKWGYPAYVNGVQPDDSRIVVRQYAEPLTPMYHNLELTISNARFEDSWNYTCIARNAAANYSMNATVHVYQKPNMSLNTQEFYFGWFNNATNLTCISQGLPHPEWTWYRSTVPVLSDVNETFHVITFDYERTSQSWLQIKPVHGSERFIFDEYQCNATNNKGTDSHRMWFRAAEPPGPPLVTIAKVTSSSAEFYLRPNNNTGGRAVERFEVSYRADFGRVGFYGPVFFPPNDPQLVRFEGLVSGMTYTFEFRSRNVRDLSFPTTLKISTEGATVPGVVEITSPNISAYPYSYFIRWKIPLTGGAVLQGYKISVQRVVLNPVHRQIQSRSEERIVMPWFLNPNIREYRIYDLLPDSDYLITVRAFTEKGFSPSPETPFLVRTAPADFLGVPPRVRGTAVPSGSVSLWLVLLALVLLLVGLAHVT